MERSILELHITNGLTSHQIAAIERVSQTTITYWLKKHGLKTKWKRGGWSDDHTRRNGIKSLAGWDWIAIQKAHDEGKTWDEICKGFKLSVSTLAKAKKQGLFHSRSNKEAARLSHDSGRRDYSVYQTPEFRKKQSRLGGYKPGSGRGKGAWVENLVNQPFWLQSSYEIRMAMILNEMGLLWERPEGIPYELESNQKRYYADFLLPDHQLYLDTKNDYLIKLDALKIEAVRSQTKINLVVVSEEQITQEFVSSLLAK